MSTKTDLERICEIARMGGCKCEPYQGFGKEWLISFMREDHVETIRDIDAVVRPEMLGAFQVAIQTHIGFGEWLMIESEFVYLLFAPDRIVWVIQHIIEPIEEAMNENDR